MVEPATRSSRSTSRRLLRQRPALVGAAILAALGLAAVAAPLVEARLGVDAEAVYLLARLAPPSVEHPLGTDELGRDLLLRLLHGGRISLLIGLGGALLAASIGVVVGAVAGFAGGRTDAFLMRLTDAVMALPLLPVLIVLAAVDLGKLGVPADLAAGPAAGIARITAIVALFGWTTVARLTRASVLGLKRRDFVRAAEALGAGRARIVLVHVLPNALVPIIVATTLSVGGIVLTESVLSFLGLGVQPPLPSWGNMLTNAQELVWEAPRLALWPGLCIFLVVLGFNLLGDGLQEALEPRSPER